MDDAESRGPAGLANLLRIPNPGLSAPGFRVAPRSGLCFASPLECAAFDTRFAAMAGTARLMLATGAASWNNSARQKCLAH
jgi:hypothetical protein